MVAPGVIGLLINELCREVWHELWHHAVTTHLLGNGYGCHQREESTNPQYHDVGMRQRERERTPAAKEGGGRHRDQVCSGQPRPTPQNGLLVYSQSNTLSIRSWCKVQTQGPQAVPWWP